MIEFADELASATPIVTDIDPGIASAGSGTMWHGLGQVASQDPAAFEFVTW